MKTSYSQRTHNNLHASDVLARRLKWMRDGMKCLCGAVLFMAAAFVLAKLDAPELWQNLAAGWSVCSVVCCCICNLQPARAEREDVK